MDIVGALDISSESRNDRAEPAPVPESMPVLGFFDRPNTLLRMLLTVPLDVRGGEVGLAIGAFEFASVDLYSLA